MLVHVPYFFFTYVPLMVAAAQCSSRAGDRLNVTNPATWRRLAEEEIDRFTNTFPFDQVYQGTNRPTSAIIFIGDGMSLSTVTAARYQKAYEAGLEAGEELMAWETWPSVSLLRTFSADRMTTDSGAAATAMFSGAKGRQNTIGLTHDAACCRCDVIQHWHRTKSMFKLAQEAGLSTGIVTTTRVTHATPAAAYANSLSREWEAFIDDKLQGPLINDSHCRDIAQQLVDEGINLNVVFGGGANKFYPNRPTNSTEESGQRKDGRDLISLWKDRQRRKGRQHQVVLNRKQLEQLDPTKTDYVLGLFAPSNMEYELMRTDQPSLAEMTDKAVRILQRNPKGFLLMVEGGRIDHGHHENRAKIAIGETLAFEQAVNTASKLTDSKETLMIVTSDHSHSYHLVGYAKRSASVLDIDDTQNGDDDMPYLISSYTTGPGAANNRSRENPLNRGNLSDTKYQQQALVPFAYATHEADDVALYATGAYNQLFQRPTDNTFVAYATMFSLCLGPYKNATHCDQYNRSVILGNHYALLIVSMMLSYVSVR